MIFLDGLPASAPSNAKNIKLNTSISFNGRDIAPSDGESTRDNAHTIRSSTPPLANPGNILCSPVSFTEIIPEMKEQRAMS